MPITPRRTPTRRAACASGATAKATAACAGGRRRTLAALSGAREPSAAVGGARTQERRGEAPSDREVQADSATTGAVPVRRRSRHREPHEAARRAAHRLGGRVRVPAGTIDFRLVGWGGSRLRPLVWRAAMLHAAAAAVGASDVDVLTRE